VLGNPTPNTSGLTPFAKGSNGTTRKAKYSPYQALVDLQKLGYAQAHKPRITPSALAQIMRAICECEERKRILRMRPKPKDIDVDPRNHRPRTRAVPAQIMNAAEPEPAALDVEAEPMPTPQQTPCKPNSSSSTTDKA